jgi:DNA-binding NarL/FixJ family response regulator
MVPNEIDQNEAARILVADDHDLIMGMLCHLLKSQAHFEVVCECVDAAGTIANVRELTPDVLVLDIGLRDMDGIEVLRRVRAVFPATEILLCSEHIELVESGLEAGARGYLIKSDAVQELVEAVRSVRKGERYMSKRLNAE